MLQNRTTIQEHYRFLYEPFGVTEITGKVVSMTDTHIVVESPMKIVDGSPTPLLSNVNENSTISLDINKIIHQSILSCSR